MTTEQSPELTELNIERMNVETVFTLGGGELNDSPWEPWATDDDGEVSHQCTFRYWYDGMPDYVERDSDHEYVTVVKCDDAPDVVYMRGSRYERVASYTSSGELQCPLADCDGDDVPEVNNRPCAFCEAQSGEDHGHVYLGEGWAEHVYQEHALCKACGADLTGDDDFDGHCDACAEHDYRVIAHCENVYRGPDETEARRVYEAHCVGEGWVALEKDGDYIAEYPNAQSEDGT